VLNENTNMKIKIHLSSVAVPYLLILLQIFTAKFPFLIVVSPFPHTYSGFQQHYQFIAEVFPIDSHVVGNMSLESLINFCCVASFFPYLCCSYAVPISDDLLYLIPSLIRH
jgi:hypothetical protein